MTSLRAQPLRLGGCDVDGARATISGFRRNSVPEFVEMPVIEERDGFDDFCVLHLKVLGVRIVVGLAVFHRRFSIEQNDDHIAVGVEARIVGTSGVDIRALNGSITWSMNSCLLL
jgi:hypothetical protein